MHDIENGKIHNSLNNRDIQIFLNASAIMQKKYHKFDNENSTFAPKDAIVFIKDGSNSGNFFHNRYDSKIASTCSYIKTTQNNMFIYYVIEGKKTYIQNNLIVGETIPHLYKKTLSDMFILMPLSLPEQEKIAQFFSLLDKQIELWEKKLQLVELIFKWYKHTLFKKITKSNKLPFLHLFKEYVVKNNGNHPQYTIGKFGIKQIKNTNYKIDGHKFFNNSSIILGLGIEEIIYNKNIIGSCSPIYKTFKLLDEYKHLENYFYFFIKKYFYSIKQKISKKSTRRDWEFDNKLLKELKIPLPNDLENKFIKKLLIIEKNINNLLWKKSNLNIKKSFYVNSILI